MGFARRVIASVSVIPKESATTEEGTTKWTLMREDARGGALGRRLGGKTNTSITSTQWGDGFYSGIPDTLYWEDMDELWEASPDVWSDSLAIGDTATQLCIETNDAKFVWIKNQGDNAVYVSLSGSSGTYSILLLVDGGVWLRSVIPTLDLNDIYVKCASGKTSKVEFILNN